MFTQIVTLLTALCKAYEQHCKTAKIRELRELRIEQAKLRKDIYEAARSANSTFLTELQNQLDTSYADSDALRNAGCNKGSEGS